LARPWAETAARLRRALEDGIDLARVNALQQAIAAGRYFVDADHVAEGILATLAPARNH
jgi:anti-sigma28 factor (negative regulator of flagellin synthesis)